MKFVVFFFLFLLLFSSNIPKHANCRKPACEQEVLGHKGRYITFKGTYSSIKNCDKKNRILAEFSSSLELAPNRNGLFTPKWTSTVRFSTFFTAWQPSTDKKLMVSIFFGERWSMEGEKVGENERSPSTLDFGESNPIISLSSSAAEAQREVRRKVCHRLSNPHISACHEHR